jgi:chemotaxis protein MotB
MKKTILIGACMALTVGILFTSCVPTRKLVASQARVGELQQDSIEAVNQLKECNVVVDNLKVQNAKAQDEYAMVRNDLKSLTAASNMTISDQAKRLKTLQNIIKSQQDIMAKLKNSIADALMNYNADELSVYTKDGNVYVSLAEKLLFKSGSEQHNEY